MARDDPYLPSPVNVSADGSTTFDGTGGSTNTAIINQISGTFDAELIVEAYDGTNWQDVGKLEDPDGNTTFTADWHTQFNRIIVSQNDRRLKISDVNSQGGWCAVDGDER